MKSNNQVRSLRWLTAFAAASFCLILTVPDASGQGTRRKRKPTKTVSTLPVMTTSSTGDAQIVSRAADFPDDSLQTVTPEQRRPESPAFDPTETSKALDDIRNRISAMESLKKSDPDEKQKRLLLNLDILNRAEQRSESLRKQLFELMEKETAIRSKLDMIEVNLRPEAIDREVAFAGTLRPEDLRAMKKKQLEVERNGLQNILTEIQKTKTVLDQNLQRSEQMVEKLRVKLDKEVDDALTDEKPL
ncbi:MAG: hypothetical protein HOP17_07525 [Acidobacteria bacterium]|nr:hypothetical protein [Acidobacteriota bacterium]